MMCLGRMNFRAIRGFSLVEMMVAMTLGVLVLLAVSEIFVNNNRTRSEIEKSSRQIENGRYAMQLLEDEISNAGFFAGTGAREPAVPFPALPPVCPLGASDVNSTLAVPVQGGNNIADGAHPACPTGDSDKLGSLKEKTDYIAIRRSSTCVAGSGSGCSAFMAGVPHVQLAACQTETDPAPGSLVIAAAADDLDALTRACDSTELAPVYRFLSRLYFVTEDNVLSRAELVPDGSGGAEYTVVPLVDGIESLHFEYGLDADDDGAVDSYSSAPVGAEWADLVAVRIWLLARNLETTPGYTDPRLYKIGDAEDFRPEDGFKRQLYSSVVRLSNLAGRREQP